MSLFELKINRDNLDEELATHASKLAYETEQHALAEEELSNLKEQLDALIAKKAAIIRQGFVAEGKTFTETRIKQDVLCDSDVREFQKYIFGKEREAAVIKGHVKARADNKDLLVQLSGRQKAEMRKFN